jgi:hypothetical protein
MSAMLTFTDQRFMEAEAKLAEETNYYRAQIAGELQEWCVNAKFSYARHYANLFTVNAVSTSFRSIEW